MVVVRTCITNVVIISFFILEKSITRAVTGMTVILVTFGKKVFY